MLLTMYTENHTPGFLDFVLRMQACTVEDKEMWNAVERYEMIRSALDNSIITIDDYGAQCIVLIDAIRGRPLGQELLEEYRKIYQKTY